MADINQVVLVGRLTRDAELKYTNSGAAICKFSLAINRRRKNGEEWVDEANFFDITLFGRQGESLSRYLQKGKQVAVQGELRQERWEQDGQSRSKVGIYANNIQLLGGNASGGGQSNFQERSYNNQPANNGGGYQQSNNQGGYSQPQQPVHQSPVQMDDFDDEIPF